MANCVRLLLALGTALAAARGAAAEADADLARDDRIAELERKVEVLTEELERTRADLAVPEVAELEGRHGLGPAASKIYDVARGLSIGGYGEGFYQKLVSDSGSGKDRADLLRMVLYAGYKFSDRILFNSEIEWEHATTSSTSSSDGGSVSVEFAALDFLWRDEANVRTGLLLLPMGFLNQTHEPPFYFGVNRPEVELRIIPTTWRENGVGLFGSLVGEQVQYQTYVVNGFNAAGFSPSGLRGGRQKGNRALAEHLAWVGSVDLLPLPGLLFGGSVYVGDSGQNQTLSGETGSARVPDTPTALWEVHAQYRARGASLRALFAMAHLQNAGKLTDALVSVGELAPGQAIAEEMLGGYAEVAYDVLSFLFPESEMSLEPFFRFEFVDTQHEMPSGSSADESKEIAIYTAGFSFKPIPNVVVKADYRNRDPESGELADELNLGVGFVF